MIKTCYHKQVINASCVRCASSVIFKSSTGTSLVVKRLGLCVSIAGVMVWSLVGELRFCKPRDAGFFFEVTQEAVGFPFAQLIEQLC